MTWTVSVKAHLDAYRTVPCSVQYLSTSARVHGPTVLVWHHATDPERTLWNGEGALCAEHLFFLDQLRVRFPDLETVDLP